VRGTVDRLWRTGEGLEARRRNQRTREELRDFFRHSGPDRGQNRELTGPDREYQLAREQREAREELDRRQNDPDDPDRDGRLDRVQREDLDREIKERTDPDGRTDQVEREEDREREDRDRQDREQEDLLPGNVVPIAAGATVAAEALADEEREAEEAAARETEASRETAQRGDAEQGVAPLDADVDSVERAEAVEAAAEADGQTRQTRDQEALATAPEVDDQPLDERDDRLVEERDERAEEARPADAVIEDHESAGEQAGQRPAEEQLEGEEIAATDEGLGDRASDPQTGADEKLDRVDPHDSRQDDVDVELHDRAGGDEATVNEPEPVLPTAGDRAEANEVENSQDAPGRAEQVPTDQEVSNDQSEALPDDVRKARDLNHGGQRPASEAATAPAEVPTSTPHRGVTAGRQHQLLREGTEQEYSGPERSIGD
jgi:hypothetical protein